MDLKKIEIRKKRAEVMVKKLKELIPQAETVLKYSSDFELLVAVILSAQCTDKMVNKVTEKLFKKYKKLDDYTAAIPEVFEQDIRSTGFYKNKTKNILASARIIKEKYNGKIPSTMDTILTLPGVARKTANVVLNIVYGKVEGIAVDTHVKRLSHVYGLSDNSDPQKIEKDLMQSVPRAQWMDFSFRMIEYGRAYCIARKHNHEACPLVLELIKFKV